MQRQVTSVRAMERGAASQAAVSLAGCARNLRGARAIHDDAGILRPTTNRAPVDWPALVEHGTALHPSAPAPDLLVPDAAEPASLPDDGARARIVGELHKAFYHRVFCFSRRFVRDEEAEEIAHEAFVRLLRVRNLERMSISVAYLLRIAENLLKRRHERALRYRRVLEESGTIAGLTQDRGQGGIRGGGSRLDPDAAEGSRADSARLEAVLAQLTREEQAAVRLIVCEGLDYQAAARSLGVPVSTINNWKHRGLSKLKRLIEAPASDASQLDTAAPGGARAAG